MSGRGFCLLACRHFPTVTVRQPLILTCRNANVPYRSQVDSPTPMKKLAVASQKGGSGKSTLCLALAVEAYRDGKASGIFDLDPQGSATSWYANRQRFQQLDDPPVIATTPPRLQADLDRMEEAGAELIIMDTPPHSEKSVAVAAAAADLVLIPCRPGYFDLHAIGFTVKLVRQQKTPAAVVLNALPPRSGLLRLEAEESVEHQRVTICPHAFCHRAAFTRPLAGGIAPQEYEPDGKAAREIRMLYKWVCQQLGW